MRVSEGTQTHQVTFNSTPTPRAGGAPGGGACSPGGLGGRQPSSERPPGPSGGDGGRSQGQKGRACPRPMHTGRSARGRGLPLGVTRQKYQVGMGLPRGPAVPGGTVTVPWVTSKSFGKPRPWAQLGTQTLTKGKGSQGVRLSCTPTDPGVRVHRRPLQKTQHRQNEQKPLSALLRAQQQRPPDRPSGPAPRRLNPARPPAVPQVRAVLAGVALGAHSGPQSRVLAQESRLRCPSPGGDFRDFGCPSFPECGSGTQRKHLSGLLGAQQLASRCRVRLALGRGRRGTLTEQKLQTWGARATEPWPGTVPPRASPLPTLSPHCIPWALLPAPRPSLGVALGGRTRSATGS